MRRFRRSFLYSPGDRPDRMRKALTLGADSVVFDLEDAVAPANKAGARATVAAAVKEAHAMRGGPEVCVRVNPASSPFHKDDVETVLACEPQCVVLPKAERPGDVRALGDRLPAGVPLVLLVETARGLLRIEDLAAASPRVEALVFGSEDFAADVGLVRSRSNLEVLYARSRVAIVAAAHGLAAIDQVFVDYKDREGLLAEAREARALGYSGKQVIHPDQIAPTHEAFTPTKEEAERAARLLAAAEAEGAAEGGGTFGYEGRMIDRPLVEQAKRVVALARHARVL